MTKRDLAWLFCEVWICAVLFLFTAWWLDHKTGVKSIEVPATLTQTLEQVEKVEDTYQQVKETTAINEEAYIKKWASFEKRLKQLEIQLAAQMATLNQYKNQHEVMVAKTPIQPLSAPQLIQLAKEIGFTTINVK